MTASKRFVNRELSWISFNQRVAMEAARDSNPLLERAKFLSIVSSNLDEFFMVRVGKLERKIDAGLEVFDPAGLSPMQQVRAIRGSIKRQVEGQYALYNDLLPMLRQNGLHILTAHGLSDAQRSWLSGCFDTQIMPVLTPRTINPSHPFPLLAAKRIYIAVLLQSDKGGLPQISLVPVPASLKRFILLPMSEGKARGVMLEDVITMHLSRLFPYMVPIAFMPFRITRNTDFVIDIENTDSLIEEMRKNIKRRSYGKIVRMEIPKKHNVQLLKRLQAALEADNRILQEVDGPLDLRFMMRELARLPGFEALLYPLYKPATDPRLAAKESIFRTIRGGDLFFHHPYDSFDPVLRFVREAADDPHVLAIKQTLYRISSRSALVPSLARAAQNGKQVTVLVEVRARFDEENNINWCQTLEKAGCHVLYGVPKWKTHSKITLIVRREFDGLRQYVHIGTGNYNDVTARQYTDMGILTCDKQIGEDAGAFFNIITGYSYTFPMQDLIASPYALRNEFVTRLQREAEHARQGLPARVRWKMNALSDPQMIEAIYAACEAGVKVQLLVRGICCLRLMHCENLTVHSIVGRFLEHSRIYIFENAGNPEVFLSSADMMQRNLDKRVELTGPVKDAAIARRIINIFDRQWADNRQSWQLRDDGQYERIENDLPPCDIQEDFIRETRAAIDTLVPTAL